MTPSQLTKPDPKLDLVLERVIDVPPELVWTAWTQPQHVRKWFTPAPWTVTDCEIDLRPGGVFRTVMRSPEGEEISQRWLLSGSHSTSTPDLDRRTAPRVSPFRKSVLHGNLDVGATR